MIGAEVAARGDAGSVISGVVREREREREKELIVLQLAEVGKAGPGLRI